MNAPLKRIAYICADPGVPVFGTKGCSVHVQEVIRTFLKQGAHVTLFAQRTGGDCPLDLAEVAVCKLPRLSKASVAARERSALAANNILRRMLEAEGPFDMVYERYSLWGFTGMEYAKEKEIPGILEVNAPLIEEQRTHRKLIHEREARHVALRTVTDASALIAVSDAVGEYLSQLSSTAGKIHVIPNGVDPLRFSPQIESLCQNTTDVFTVGFVGTLKPWHGVLDLVEAFSILHKQAPESRLLLVGEGPERLLIEARLAAHGLTLASHFAGAVHPTDVPGFISSMDVSVAPYPALENCYFSPLKAFEYMATGKAFVGSKIGQLGALITHGEDGLLYTPGDVDQLASHLVRLYENPELCRSLGKAARQTVMQSYTWDAVGARIFAIAASQHVFEVA